MGKRMPTRNAWADHARVDNEVSLYTVILELEDAGGDTGGDTTRIVRVKSKGGAAVEDEVIAAARLALTPSTGEPITVDNSRVVAVFPGWHNDMWRQK